MSDPNITRRDLLYGIGTAGASGTALGQTHAHGAAGAAVPAKAYQRKIFNDRQWSTVQALCDLILPADGRSGSATQAGVPEFIDDWLDFRKQQDGNGDFAAQILGGMAWLDLEAERLFQKPFASAGPGPQKQILDRIAWPGRAAPEDRRWAAFFSKFRDLTVSGFFSSGIGIKDLPYLGNTAVAEWKGCSAEVWAIIEDRMKNGYQGLGGVSTQSRNVLFPAK
ncbi:MAG: gluconate 2-dehydrogenase subunit 3 family protein [Acidobacteriia bacterium]|nr:gluconate 2-dehydrogenase subunit 3 family protein [Terriglobia bacterium]